MFSCCVSLSFYRGGATTSRWRQSGEGQQQQTEQHEDESEEECHKDDVNRQHRIHHL